MKSHNPKPLNLFRGLLYNLMSIFAQDIDNSVYNTLISDQKSEFWESWVRPTFSLGVRDVIEFEIHDKGLLHLKTKNKGVTLGDGNIYLYSNNFPNKYFSFICGIDFSSSTICLMGKSKPLLADEFNTIRCRYAHVRHIPILKGFNIRTKMNCQLYGVREAHDTYFGSDVEFESERMPVLMDCSSAPDIEATFTVNEKPTGGLLYGLMSLRPPRDTNSANQILWIAPYECNLSDIVNISNLSCKKIHILCPINKTHASYLHIVFTKTDNPSRSNVWGWDVTYYRV